MRAKSSAALQYWFGVSEHTVWKWRQAFGTPRYGRPRREGIRPAGHCRVEGPDRHGLGADG
jgi:hypothetical protein